MRLSRNLYGVGKLADLAFSATLSVSVVMQT